MFEEFIVPAIKQACETNSVPELADEIKYEFNGRFTSRLGDAIFGKKLIRFSIYLWNRASPKEKFDVVIHETCHIIARYKYGLDIHPHGVEWRMCMMNAGIEPKRLHNINREGLTRRVQRYQASCDCGRFSSITKNRLTRMMKGNVYRCKFCMSTIKLVQS